MALPPYSLGPPLSAASSRNLRGSNAVGYRYQSPFLDVANTYLPPSVKELFRLTRYYGSSDPLIAPLVEFLSSYPITKIEVDEQGNSDTTYRGLTQRWRAIFDSENGLNLVDSLTTGSFHLNVFGNWFGSIQFPFDKHLHCASCGNRELAQTANYVFRDFRFDLTCRKCGATSVAQAEDVYKVSMSVRLVTWDPDLISIDHNPLTAASAYYLRVPDEVQVGLRMGRRHIIETTPQVFLDATKHSKPVLLNRKLFFHVRTPGSVHWNQAWGWPVVVPALKPSFYTQILRKGQEAIALGRTIPFTVLFPSAVDANASPVATIRLKDWESRVRAELQKHRLDPNYTAIMPIPIGSHNLWGDGKALMLTGELEINQRQVLLSLGVPPGLMTGEITWNSASVAMRALEQRFLRRRHLLLRLVNQVIVPRVASYLHLPPVTARMTPFKMADDMARKSLIQMLSQGPAPKVSDETFFTELDLDLEGERARVRQQEDYEYEQSVRKIRRAVALQKLTAGATPGEPGEPGTPGGPGAAPASASPEGGMAGPQPAGAQLPPAQQPALEVPADAQRLQSLSPEMQVRLRQEAVALVRQLLQLPQEQARDLLNRLRGEQPLLFRVVVAVFQELQASRQRTRSQRATQKDLPERTPPKRAPEHASI